MELKGTTQYLADFFNGNPILNIVFLILAILGIIFTTYFYYKSRKSKIPTYIVRTINLVREKIQKIETVEIIYSGEKVKNLSLTKIAIWNDGKETINYSDIASNNPIRIKIKESFEILDAEILFKKDEANDFNIQVSDDKNYINILFDYIDFEDGIVIQIFHTGNSSDDIFIDGKIKSVKNIHRREHSNSLLPDSIGKLLRNDREYFNRKAMKSFFGWSFIVVGLVFNCLLLYFPTRKIIAVTPKPHESSIFFIILLLLPGILYMWFGYNLIKRRIPKGFDIFNEEF